LSFLFCIPLHSLCSRWWYVCMTIPSIIFCQECLFPSRHLANSLCSIELCRNVTSTAKLSLTT
jgi:hypothetical protein